MSDQAGVALSLSPLARVILDVLRIAPGTVEDIARRDEDRARRRVRCSCRAREHRACGRGGATQVQGAMRRSTAQRASRAKVRA